MWNAKMSEIKLEQAPTVEFLLKQVYAAHKNVVKNLAAENQCQKEQILSLQNELTDVKHKYEQLLLRDPKKENNGSQRSPSLTRGSPEEKLKRGILTDFQPRTAEKKPRHPPMFYDGRSFVVPETVFPDEVEYDEDAEAATGDALAINGRPESPNVIAGTPESIAGTNGFSVRKIQPSCSLQSTQLHSSNPTASRGNTCKKPNNVEDDGTLSPSYDAGSPTLCKEGWCFLTPASRPGAKRESGQTSARLSTNSKRVRDPSDDMSTKRIRQQSSVNVNGSSSELADDADCKLDDSLNATYIPPEVLRQFQVSSNSMDADFFTMSDEELLDEKEITDVCRRNNSPIREIDGKKMTTETEKFPYAFKNGPIRKKDERQKLDGHACQSCRDYYASMGLNEREIQERLKNSSRHRHQFARPPDTPRQFWSPGFPDTPECKRLGHIEEKTQCVPLESWRTKPSNRKGS